MAQPTRRIPAASHPPEKPKKKASKPKPKKKTTDTGRNVVAHVSESDKKPKKRGWKNHPQYGTSKLEEKFAKNFLDKLGLEYEYQFFAKSIGRYYDFLVGGDVLIEVDGTYYHSYGVLEEDMNRMQRKNKRVDEIKNQWAAMNGIPLYRFWEHEINNSPEKVMERLRDIFYIRKERKKRHNRSNGTDSTGTEGAREESSGQVQIDNAGR